MDDENRLPEIDALVRDAVTPPDDAVDRVVLKALGDNREPPRRRGGWLAMVTAGAFVLVLGIAAWQWARIADRRAGAASLAIKGEGSMLVVESQDGRRWVVGPPPKRRIGSNFVLVVPE
jgi:hypothetical protein